MDRRAGAPIFFQNTKVSAASNTQKPRIIVC